MGGMMMPLWVKSESRPTALMSTVLPLPVVGAGDQDRPLVAGERTRSNGTTGRSPPTSSGWRPSWIASVPSPAAGMTGVCPFTTTA